MTNRFPYRLYLVVSESSIGGRSLETVVEQAILGGVDLVQLREKEVAPALFMERALRLAPILDKHGVPLIINDDLEIAMAINAHGIHVGSSDVLPHRIRTLWKDCSCLGRSIENVAQLQDKETPVVDYLGISPVFRTPTKTDTVTEWGLEGIAKIRELTSKPLVAIGNMNAGNARAVIGAGADCIAVVSAICGAKDPQRAA